MLVKRNLITFRIDISDRDTLLQNDLCLKYQEKYRDWLIDQRIALIVDRIGKWNLESLEF